MRAPIAVAALVFAGCVYDYSALSGKGVDASDAASPDSGIPDVLPEVRADSTGAGGIGGSSGPGGTTGTAGTPGRPNGAGCTADGDCTSRHCVRSTPADASGQCCDGIPGDCTTCVNGYRVPKNDGTIVNCQACSKGTPSPYSGPADMDGTDAVCLGGSHYAEPTAGPCARKMWTIVASPPCGGTCIEVPVPMNAIDGTFASRYTTGRPQGSLTAEVIEVTFPAVITTTGLWLFSGPAGDAPEAYRVDYSIDGSTFTRFMPDVAGPGSRNLTIPFPAPTTVRALRITQTGTKPISWWSVAELNVLDCAPK